MIEPYTRATTGRRTTSTGEHDLAASTGMTCYIVCVCACVCVCVHVCVCMCVCVYVCVRVHVWLYECLRVRVFVNVWHMWDSDEEHILHVMCACVCACVCVYMVLCVFGGVGCNYVCVHVCLWPDGRAYASCCMYACTHVCICIIIHARYLYNVHTWMHKYIWGGYD